jgi:hypothetical protein
MNADLEVALRQVSTLAATAHLDMRSAGRQHHRAIESERHTGAPGGPHRAAGKSSSTGQRTPWSRSYSPMSACGRGADVGTVSSLNALASSSRT